MKNKKNIIVTSSEYQTLKDEISFDFSLKNKTSFKIGGNAEIFFAPKTFEHLCFGLAFFTKLSVPISLLGGGTNLLIADEGIDGVILSLEHFNDIKELADNRIAVGAGVLSEELSAYSVALSLAGFENFAYLPGTIAGALYMNARCYGSEISTTLESLRYLQFSNKTFYECEYRYNKADWDYKKSPFQNGRDGIRLCENARIILSARFKLEAGNKTELESLRQQRINDRIQKGHFLKPSCGSTFKNNRSFGKSSGAIIDALGLKGLKIGDAEVAPFHANFIINNGNATARDVRALIKKIQKTVKDKSGFELEPEVIFAG